VGVFDDGDQFEALGVENSNLESHRTKTHDEESGSQYNFVEQEAQEQRTRGPSGGKTLSDLLAGGAEVEVVDLKDAASSGLRELIQQMFSGLHTTKPSKPKPAPLASVPPDTPVSQLLKMVRQSTHDIPITPRASSGRSSVVAGEADAVSYLDHMDATGLEMLEAELLQKLRRVRAAKERRGANVNAQQASAASGTVDEAAPAARASSLSDALSESLGLKPSGALTALGLNNQAAESEASADDDVNSYAERLSREALQRERPAGEEGEEAGSSGTSIPDLLQQMIGGDGPVVKFEVVMGDGSEVATGGGGLSALLESLRSQIEGDDNDDDEEEE